MATPLYTKDNAKIYAAKGHATQSRLAAERRAAKAAAKAGLLPPQEPAVVIQPLAVITADDSYRLARLERVRKQIAIIEDAIEETSDPMQFDQLTRAIGRLSEIERQLAGRPMPGSRRPPPDRQAKRPETRQLMPLMDPEPTTAVPQPDNQPETSPPADTLPPQT